MRVHVRAGGARPDLSVYCSALYGGPVSLLLPFVLRIISLQDGEIAAPPSNPSLHFSPPLFPPSLPPFHFPPPLFSFHASTVTSSSSSSTPFSFQLYSLLPPSSPAPSIPSILCLFGLSFLFSYYSFFPSSLDLTLNSSLTILSFSTFFLQRNFFLSELFDLPPFPPSFFHLLSISSLHH